MAIKESNIRMQMNNTANPRIDAHMYATYNDEIKRDPHLN